MTLNDFLKVYWKDEPFRVEVVQPWGDIDWYGYQDKEMLRFAQSQAMLRGDEHPIYGIEEIECIYHDEDDILTITLKEDEEV